jgi:hypothetical protein
MPGANTQKTQVVDKNGKVTHVHKNLDHPGGASVATRGTVLVPTISRKGSPVPGGLTDLDLHNIQFIMQEFSTDEGIGEDDASRLGDNVADYIESITTGEQPIADDFGSDLDERWTKDDNNQFEKLGKALRDASEGTGIDDEGLDNLTHDVARYIDANMPQKTPDLVRYPTFADASLAAASIPEDSPILARRIAQWEDGISDANRDDYDEGDADLMTDQEIHEEAVSNARYDLMSDTVSLISNLVADESRPVNSYASEAASLIIGWKDTEFGKGAENYSDKAAAFITKHKLYM